MENPADCFYSKLEEIFDNAELIITALRDLTYSSADLTMGDTEEDVQEFLSQIEQFRGRINLQKENEERSKEELKQRLVETEANLRDLEHSKEEALKESEDKFEKMQKKNEDKLVRLQQVTEIKFADLEKSKKEEIEKLQSSLSNNEVNLDLLLAKNENLQEKLKLTEEEAKVYKNELDSVTKTQKRKSEEEIEKLQNILNEKEVNLDMLRLEMANLQQELRTQALKLSKNEMEIKFKNLEKSKQEEIDQLQSVLNNTEVNLGMLRIINENLQETLRSSEEEVKVYKTELDLIREQKLEVERKLEKVFDVLGENKSVSRRNEATPGSPAGEIEEESREEEMPSRPSIADVVTFKTERRSLPLREGNGDYSSDESEDGEEDVSTTTLPCTDSEAPGENDNQNEAQSDPVDNKASKSSQPSPKRSTRLKKKKAVFSPARRESPRKTPRLEGDPPPNENLIRTTNTKKGFQCRSCEKTYTNVHALNRHVDSLHLKIRFVCPVCGNKFTTERYWRIHMKRCKSRGLKGCKQCKKRFRSLEELKGHQKSEHSVK